MTKIKQRKRVFIGCEGSSERSYVRWVQETLDGTGNQIFFDTEIAGGGDPLAIVSASIKRMNRKIQQSGGFRARAILLDEDRRGVSPNRDAMAVALATKNDVDLLWQRWDHEAYLLRHIAGNETRHPAKGTSENELKKIWGDYEKPATALWLGKRIGLQDWIRALNHHPQKKAFFQKVLSLDGIT